MNHRSKLFHVEHPPKSQGYTPPSKPIPFALVLGAIIAYLAVMTISLWLALPFVQWLTDHAH
jgi:multisubunit Na+/H+ antiporter MnhC subunit